MIYKVNSTGKLIDSNLEDIEALDVELFDVQIGDECYFIPIGTSREYKDILEGFVLEMEYDGKYYYEFISKNKIEIPNYCPCCAETEPTIKVNNFSKVKRI